MSAARRKQRAIDKAQDRVWGRRCRLMMRWIGRTPEAKAEFERAFRTARNSEEHEILFARHDQDDDLYGAVVESIVIDEAS
jgi:predicted RNA polymerase sigma factor